MFVVFAMGSDAISSSKKHQQYFICVFCLKIRNFVGVVTNSVVAIATIVVFVTSKHSANKKIKDA